VVIGPKGRAAWTIKDAQYFGLAQRRERVVLVADFGNGADPAAVLFEPLGVRWDHPPRRQTGQGIAGTLEPRASGDGGEALIAGTVSSKWAKGTGGPAGDECYNLVAHTLRGEGFDASEDGTGRGTPLVPVAFDGKQITSPQNRSRCSAGDPAPTLRAGGFKSSHANAGVMPAVTVSLRGRDGGGTIEAGGEVATALRASAGGGDKPHVFAPVFSIQERAVCENPNAGPGGAGFRSDGLAYTMEARTTAQAIANEYAVRRLTPRECERLMGFPDDYTRIPWRGKPASECPDGPRYKALGNSWAVPQFRWVGERIQKFMPKEESAT